MTRITFAMHPVDFSDLAWPKRLPPIEEYRMDAEPDGSVTTQIGGGGLRFAVAEDAQNAPHLLVTRANEVIDISGWPKRDRAAIDAFSTRFRNCFFDTWERNMAYAGQANVALLSKTDYTVPAPDDWASVEMDLDDALLPVVPPTPASVPKGLVEAGVTTDGLHVWTDRGTHAVFDGSDWTPADDSQPFTPPAMSPEEIKSVTDWSEALERFQRAIGQASTAAMSAYFHHELAPDAASRSRNP